MNHSSKARGSRTQILMALGAGLLTAASGCTLEPHYDRPKVGMPPAWPEGPAYVFSPSLSEIKPTRSDGTAIKATDLGWREFFPDPLLQRLIELALVHNPDARTAALNVAAARAQYRIQRADLFPAINATGIEQVEKYPTGVSTNSVGSGPTAISGLTRFYDVGIGFTSYEIDLFGRIRSLDKEKLEQYFAYEETRRSTQISLVAEVATIYLAYLADIDLFKLTQDTLVNQQASYDLAKLRFDSGVATELDLRQAEIALDTARANLEQYSRLTAQDLNQFVLVGVPLRVEDLPAGLPFADYNLMTELPPNLPSQVLLDRPDVLSAEHNLRAANADIGAARAAFFPSITLTGSYGTASKQLSGLFDHGSNSWTFSPQISLPIFAAGANMASLDLSKIEKDVNVATYEKTVLTAFQEVADALAARSTLDREIANDQALVDASAAAYKLSQMRFENGVDNYLSVLDSQRSLYSAKQTLITTRLSRLQNLVTLYKALGGGLSEHTMRDTAVAARPQPGETSGNTHAATIGPVAASRSQTGVSSASALPSSSGETSPLLPQLQFADNLASLR